MSTAQGRSLAEEIGRAYDAIPYDPAPNPALRPAALRGAAAALGIVPSPGSAIDVLDIGCGTGSQLLDAARLAPGRAVGIDASAEACARARSRGAVLGARWDIRHGDIAAATPESLGQFDVIYLVGTAYVMPPAARQAAFDLLAGCLRPGGVAVVTGYTGLAGLAHARLAGLLRAASDPAQPEAARLAQARADLRALAAAIPGQGPLGQGPSAALARSTIAAMEGAGDVVLFHEALGQVFDPLHASEVERVLAPHGLAYLNHLPPVPMMAGAGSAAAARAADGWDFVSGGGYRSMLFARPGAAGAAGAAGVRNPGITWAAGLRRVAGAGGQVVFTDPAGRSTINPNTAWARAHLEAVAASGGGRWQALRDGALARLAGLGAPQPAPREMAAFEAGVDELLRLLWTQGLAQPIFAD